MLIRIFEIVAPILFVVLVGFFYARKRRPNLDHANSLNIDVFVPFLILAVFTGQSIDVAQYKTLMLVVAGLTLVPGLLAIPVCRLLNVHWKTLLPPMMFKNSGNLGIPLLLLAFGEDALPAILMMFIVENTLHFSVGLWMLSTGARNLKFLLQPMMMATILGLSLSMAEITLPEWLVTGFELLGDIAVPLMLFALGVRMTDLDFHGWRLGVFGALLAPALGLLAAWPILSWLSLPPDQEKMAWIFAALPPAVLNYLVAERYRQEPDKVASIVMFANAGAVVIIPLILFWVL
ncbi:AEC family transporter [Reinekea blandensis]|uniref:Auxin Efflux Carrier n=1 Tax=Reinekea blandensis MED297 TaxID=314283 RepID=A4BJU0_9GAMM|nr:AEC family transporter [Reinekea blandensis]EAR07607.1 Auxin Efflux Carrier [Reinekea sp. MED297] [Reinekea blandensis MED297]